MADDIRVDRSLPRLVIGLAIIVAGILFMLDNLGLVHAEHYLEYWPVVLLAIGVVQMVQTGSWVGYGWSLVWIVAGLWLLGQNIGLITISIWALWPLLLVLVGASVIWRACCPPVVRSSACCPPVIRSSARAESSTTPPGEPAQARTSALGVPRSARESFVHAFAVLGAQERTVGTAEFRGADLVALMGACKLDLRRATMVGEEVVIDVLALMGGVDILIPESWTVEAKVLPVMGGLGDHTHPIASGKLQRLVIRGLALMGGVEVKN
jgi:predicted membrane protein